MFVCLHAEGDLIFSSQVVTARPRRHEAPLNTKNVPNIAWFASSVSFSILREPTCCFLEA